MKNPPGAHSYTSEVVIADPGLPSSLLHGRDRSGEVPATGLLRCHRRGVGGERLAFENVEAGSGQLAGAERRDEGRLLDKRAAGDVHQDGARLQLGEVASAQRITGALGEDEEDAEDVGGGQELVLADLRYAELGA